MVGQMTSGLKAARKEFRRWPERIVAAKRLIHKAQRRWVALGAILLALTDVCKGAELPPIIPVGLDAFRQWERWPYQRIGARAYMRSTYDRRGGNEAANASHFIYQLADDYNVSLEVTGPGVLYFVRCNHWHGSPWHYEVDGRDHVVQESSTAQPNQPVEGAVFIPEQLFPSPLAVTWSLSKGADLSWVPIPFEKSFRLGYGRTHYGTGYYTYHQYMPGAELSQPLRSWDAATRPGHDVLELIPRAGTDLAPSSASRVSGQLNLKAAETAVLVRLSNA